MRNRTMKNSAFKIPVYIGFILLMIMSFSNQVMAWPWSSTIEYTIKTEVDLDEVNGNGYNLVRCDHFYSVDQNGKQIIPLTPLPPNQTTVVQLPKTNDNYTVRYYYQPTYKGSGQSELKEIGIADTFSGNSSKKVTFDAGFGHGLMQDFSFLPSGFSISTSASEDAGETDVSVPLAVVAGLAGAAAAAGAAGAAAAAGAGGAGSGSGEGSSEEGGGSTYKLKFYKEFGNKIKYNDTPVFVYARMVEVNKEGAEIERPDLTQHIEIFSEASFLEIGPNTLAGAYMGASVAAQSATENTAQMPKEGTISVRFIGAGGTFQNNIKFNMVGEAYIEFVDGKMFVLAMSGQSYEHEYKLVDFLNPVEVTVKTWQENSPFDLSIGKNKEGQTVVIATDKQPPKTAEAFFESFNCEIEARNEKEYARTVFSVVMCYEGLLPVFQGGKKEIAGYLNEQEEMAKTNVLFQVGIWNKETNRLEFQKLNEVTLECTDENGIYEAIGLEAVVDPENHYRESGVMYQFKAEKPLPAMNPVKGSLKSSYTLGEREFSNDTAIELIPDKLLYEKNYEQEYQNCLKTINTYMPEPFKSKKLKELEKNRGKVGLEDLKLFRKGCWSLAEHLIMQEKESYLIESYWYDEAIATAELLVYVGDIAFDVALAPFGGPIAGFLASHVKASLIDAITMYVEKPSIGMAEIWEFCEKRAIMIAGQADGLIEVPKPEKPALLIAWLSIYTVYRICYHWQLDKDEENNSIGIAESINRGLLDFAGKGASTILSAFAGEVAKKKGWDKYSVADADQEYVNKQVSKGAREALDYADKAAGYLDDRIAVTVRNLLDYIEKLRMG
ncbi:MAG: hypothetical protein ACM3QW_00800 [Ignavibacteriales bacterium]